MKLFWKGKDGGPESTVWGYWLIEWKPMLSIALLRFEDGSREVHHTHAFNALSWLLKGKLVEDKIWFNENIKTEFKPSLKPIFTGRHNLHRVSSQGKSWAITLRGPWNKYWMELTSDGKLLDLTHGRRVIS